jgi:26S proteasome non-ATPase regulatory subunit 9
LTKKNFQQLQGFPLPNLDLAAVRGDRHLVITRMNDHKDLTNRVEEAVKRLLEESSRAAGGAAAAGAAADADAPAGAAAARGAPPPPARPAAASAAAAPLFLNRLLPFARVDDVSPLSPAEEAGMAKGDRVVSFGAVSVSSASSAGRAPPSAPAPLTQLPAEVAAALASGAGIDVVVLRAGGSGEEEAVREVTLRLTPREGWGGRGALGCHLKPL